jgi:hypothetical protein
MQNSNPIAIGKPNIKPEIVFDHPYTGRFVILCSRLLSYFNLTGSSNYITNLQAKMEACANRV